MNTMMPSSAGRFIARPSVWCAACNSFHVKPRSRAHHQALRCFAPFVDRKKKYRKAAES